MTVKETITTIGKPVPRQKSQNGSAGTTLMPVEFRGIDLHQLRAIKANVERRCGEGKWTGWKGNLLTPEKVNFHDVNKYVTKQSESSFVETLPSTAGTQPPLFFVSQTWGETFFQIMDCIEQMDKNFKRNWDDSEDKEGCGTTEETPIWRAGIVCPKYVVSRRLQSVTV